MENPSSEMFYKLISESKLSKESSSTCIQTKDQKYFEPGQQAILPITLRTDENYDSAFLELCNIRCNEAESDFLSQPVDCLVFTNKDIEDAIDKMNSGKSADEYALTAEHLKSAKQLIAPVITNTFNQILKNKEVPSSFKTGIITPVLKKGKDSKSMEN